MDPLTTAVRKALGEDLWKRFSAAHKGQIVRVGEHVGKAMGFHKSGVMNERNAMKAHGSAIECCKRMSDSFDKALALHKAHFGKAIGSESNQYPHAEVNGHLEECSKAMNEMKGHMANVSKASQTGYGFHKDTHDQHELAQGTINKVTSSWVGQEGDSPAAAGPGYDPVQAGHTSNLPQSHLTEGDVADYDPFSPYPGKAATPPANGGNQVTEAEAKAREEVALLKGRNEALQAEVARLGNLPVDPKGRIFNGAGPGAAEPTDPVDKIIAKLREAGQLSKFELDNLDKPDVRQRLCAKAIGMQAVIGDPELVNPALRDTSFARSLLHPAMRSDPNVIAKRGTAAGEHIFNPNGPTNIYAAR